MPTRQVVFALISFLHDFFTVVWIGGLFALALVVLPVALRTWGRGPETKRLMDAIQRRLSPLVYVSIVGLAVTGVLLARRNPAYGGLFSFTNPYSTVLSLKHILVLLMVAVALLRSVALRTTGQARRAGQPRDTGQPQPQALERLRGALLYLNLALGVLVLLLSGFSAALAAGAPPV